MSFITLINKMYVSPERIINWTAGIKKNADSAGVQQTQHRFIVNDDGSISLNTKNPDVIKSFEDNIKILSGNTKKG